jgi:hypothetical protein
MNKKISTFGLLAGLSVGLSMLALGAMPVFAETPSPLHSGPNCTSLILLPQNKEEIGLSDVKRAIKIHLLRIGAEKHDVKVSWYDDDIIAAEISYRGNLRRHIKIDAANAQIIERIEFRKPVGFRALPESQVKNASSSDHRFNPQVEYSRQLRRHMLGDGKAWATWVGKRKGSSCLNDYRFGGPSMPDPGM